MDKGRCLACGSINVYYRGTLANWRCRRCLEVVYLCHGCYQFPAYSNLYECDECEDYICEECAQLCDCQDHKPEHYVCFVMSEMVYSDPECPDADHFLGCYCPECFWGGCLKFMECEECGGYKHPDYAHECHANEA